MQIIRLKIPGPFIIKPKILNVIIFVVLNFSGIKIKDWGLQGTNSFIAVT